MTIAKILLTHDGSELADAAVPRARALALAAKAELVLLRTVEPTATAILAYAGAESELVAEAQRELDGLKAELEGAGVRPVVAAVRSGAAGPLIVETAAALHCDVTVISTHGRSGLKRAFLGSVADYVVRHSQGIPVLLCRPEPADVPDALFKKILLTLDGSELGAAAAETAQAVASVTGAEVVLLRVVDTIGHIVAMTTPAGYEFGPGIVSQELIDQIVAGEHDSAQAEVDAAAARLRAAGVTRVTEVIEPGAPGETIVSTAERLGCDVIAMSSHGRGGLGRALLGSVADHVLRNVTRAAVLVVRPQD